MRREREQAHPRQRAAAEALLAAVRRSAPRPGGANEEAALAAFREARDSGAHAAPGHWWQARRRDDWRPSRRWRGALPVRAAFASLAATVTLGGVALAAGTGALPAPFGIGEGGSGGPGAGVTATRSSAPATPGTSRESGEGAARRASPTVTTQGPARPARGRSDVAQCVAYLVPQGRGVAGRGEASARLTADADDAGLTVEAYCEDVLAAEKRQRGPGAADQSDPPEAPKAPQPSAPPQPPQPPAKPESDGKAADPAEPADKRDDGKGGRQGGSGTKGNGGSESRKQ